jgi:adenylate cyclase, class 2
MIEREVKIRVTDHEAIRPLLQAMGAVRARSEQEINHIFDTADGALRKRGEVLRVRSADTATITWKGPAAQADQQNHKVREELETEIAVDGTESLVAILGRLGFQETVRYRKQRETWHWQGLTIALDELVFGNFVEIEGDAGAIQGAMHLLHLENEPLETRSYPELQRRHDQSSGS